MNLTAVSDSDCYSCEQVSTKRHQVFGSEKVGRVVAVVKNNFYVMNVNNALATKILTIHIAITVCLPTNEGKSARYKPASEKHPLHHVYSR